MFLQINHELLINHKEQLCVNRHIFLNINVSLEISFRIKIGGWLDNNTVSLLWCCCRRTYRSQSATELLAQPIAVVMVPTSVNSSNAKKDVVANEGHCGQVVSWTTVGASVNAEEKSKWAISITVDDCFGRRQRTAGQHYNFWPRKSGGMNINHQNWFQRNGLVIHQLLFRLFFRNQDLHTEICRVNRSSGSIRVSIL